MSQHFTGIGNLTKDFELRTTQGGTFVANGAIAINKRVRDKDTGEWSDKLMHYRDLTIWGALGENAAASLRKGDRVIVVGEIETDFYADKNTGQERQKQILKVDAIGPDLRFSTAQPVKAGRDGAAQPTVPQSTPAAQPAAVPTAQPAAPPPADMPF